MFNDKNILNITLHDEGADFTFENSLFRPGYLYSRYGIGFDVYPAFWLSGADGYFKI